MSTRLLTLLVLLSLAKPSATFGQDSLSVEQRLTRIETQLGAIIETLSVMDTTASAVSSRLPDELEGSEPIRWTGLVMAKIK